MFKVVPNYSDVGSQWEVKTKLGVGGIRVSPETALNFWFDLFMPIGSVSKERPHKKEFSLLLLALE